MAKLALPGYTSSAAFEDDTDRAVTVPFPYMVSYIYLSFLIRTFYTSNFKHNGLGGAVTSLKGST